MIVAMRFTYQGFPVPFSEITKCRLYRSCGFISSPRGYKFKIDSICVGFEHSPLVRIPSQAKFLDGNMVQIELIHIRHQVTLNWTSITIKSDHNLVWRLINDHLNKQATWARYLKKNLQGCSKDWDRENWFSTRIFILRENTLYTLSQTFQFMIPLIEALQSQGINCSIDSRSIEAFLVASVNMWVDRIWLFAML